MFLIVGLGNPDDKYAKTRHNVGFDTVDKLAEKYNINMNIRKGRAFCGSGYIEGQKVLLAKPQTYMNLSGDSVSSLVNFYKMDMAEEVIVIFDDISLEPGELRIRMKGSAGGHNGIKDIIAKTGSDQFSRIKVGVGAKPQGWDLAKHVLSRFSKEERENVEKAMDDAVKALLLMITDRADEAMNLYNKKKQKAKKPKPEKKAEATEAKPAGVGVEAVGAKPAETGMEAVAAKPAETNVEKQ